MLFIFKIHALIMLELITLGVGTALLMKAHKAECCRGFFKAISYFIIVFSFLTMICSAYDGLRLVREYKNKPHGMMGMGTDMMKECHGDCPMMKDCPMMEEHKAESAPSGGVK